MGSLGANRQDLLEVSPPHTRLQSLLAVSICPITWGWPTNARNSLVPASDLRQFFERTGAVAQRFGMQAEPIEN